MTDPTINAAINAAIDAPATASNLLPCHAIVEAVGHQRHAGYLSEVTLFGQTFARLDIPPVPADEAAGHTAEQPVTLLYHPGSLYRVTPVDEAAARQVATHERHRPLSFWELPTHARPADVPY